MKKIIFLMLFAVLSWQHAVAQYTAIPDQNFEQALIARGLDDAIDGQVLTANISGVASLNVRNCNIYNLTGIQDFDSLTYLRCDENHVSALDVSGLANLTELYCNDNFMTSLNIAGLTNLHVLYYWNNWLNCIQATAASLAHQSEQNWQGDGTASFDFNGCGTPSALTAIPDANFERKLKNLGYDNIIDGNVLTSNINGIIALNIAGQNISDLTGLQDFVSLKHLNCSNNQITTLSLCSLINLETLDCTSNNGLFSIEVGNENFANTNFTKDELANFAPTCPISNPPTAVDQSFYSNDNPTVANLVAAGINLKWYDAATGGTALLSDTLLSTNTYYVSQNENGFESNRTAVNITINQATIIPDQNFEQALIELGYDNIIDGRVVTSNINGIENLDISRKGIVNFTGLQDFVNLRNLNIMGNNGNNWWAPMNLDVSGLTNLQILSCGGNTLESLNVTGLSNLISLECTQNSLTTLDLTGLYNLQYLYCQYNQLTSLNVNGSPRLSYFYCDNNNLTTLDLSRLFVFPNGTTPQLFSFSSLNNYNLYCIQVATLADANVNPRWHKDDWASYANNCSGIAEPIADAQSFCNSGTVANLVAIGENLKWFTVQTSGIPLDASTALTSTTYYVSQTINGIEGPRKAVNVTVSSNIIPSFSTVAPICSGGILAALPTTSTNGIVGTWNSAVNNMATTTYTFTPNEGQCALTNTITITVNPNVIPAFDSIAPICSGGFLAALPTTSTNGIAGTWSPALSNTETKTYTFAPNDGQCGATSTLTITVTPNVTPIFNAVAPICSGEILSVLPTTSNNGIAGTWSPALSNTETKTYTFTPNVGQCASTTTLTITVTPKVTPTFVQIPTLCPNATLQPLPTTSTNGVIGTWNLTTIGDANSNYARVYTFTPSLGQCAEATTMVIFRMQPLNAGVVTGGTSVCSGALSDVLTLTGANGSVVRWESSTNNFATKTIIDNIYTTHNPGPLTATTKFRAVVDAGCGAAISGSATVVMLPAISSPATLKLTDSAINNSNGITIVSKYIGTNTPLTLTATPVTGATAYQWELPQGVNQTAGGTSNVITINFAGVASGTSSMYIGVKTKIGSCISTRSNSGLTPATGSSARVLLVTASLPTAPTNIILTNNGTTITDLGKYIGTNSSLTLMAIPSANANSYEWELPAGVNQLSGGTTNTISVNLLNVPAGTMWLYFGVKAKNGVGVSVTDNSTLFPNIISSARLLKVQSKFPSPPADITLKDNGMTVTNFGKYIGTTSALTLTATPVANANSYVWELPSGVNQISGGTTNVITVNFASVPEGTTILYLGAKAKNGVGVSTANNSIFGPAITSTASLMKVTASVPIASTALTLTYNGTTVSDFGEYIGTTNTLTLTANESANANSYIWELPSGVNKTSGGSTNTISINFADVTEGTTTLYLGVIAKNGVGNSIVNNSALVPATSSTARLLKVSTTLPASPPALILTTFGDNPVVVTNVSKFIGTQENLRLTATPSPNSTSYEWELPAGVNKLTGGNTNVITVNFWNVSPGTTSMYIGVKAKNAVGISKRNNSTLLPPTSSTAKLLKVTASIPASPTMLQLLTFDDQAVTDFGKYIGTTANVKLKSNLAANATGFQWELPTGVNQMPNAGTTDEIYVNFAGVPNGTTTLYFGVKAKNGVGVSSTDNSAVLPVTSSTAKLLKVTASPPLAPASITMNDINSAIKVSNLGAYIGTYTIWTITAAESAKASSYIWELPAGVNQISGGTSSSIKVNFAGVAPGTTSLYIGVKAKNGIGISTTDNTNLLPATTSTARLLKLTPSVPSLPQFYGPSVGICAGSVYRYEIQSSPSATSYIITAPVGSRVTSANNPSNLTNVLATSDLFFDVLIPANFNTLTSKTMVIYAVNGVGSSLTGRTYTLSENPNPTRVIIGSYNFKRCGTQTYEALTATGAVSYLWEVTNGAVIVGDSDKKTVVVNFSAVPASATTNVIKVKTVSACGNLSAVKSNTLTSVSCRTTDEDAFTSSTETNVYPNPTKGDFKLDITAWQAGTLDIEIYTINGVTVKSRKAINLQEGANTIDENISDLADGLYFVRLTNNVNNEVTVKRLIKQ